MDALLHRHRGGRIGHDEIPVLTELAPAAHEVDIPVLTDIAPPFLPADNAPPPASPAPARQVDVVAEDEDLMFDPADWKPRPQPIVIERPVAPPPKAPPPPEPPPLANFGLELELGLPTAAASTAPPAAAPAADAAELVTALEFDLAHLLDTPPTPPQQVSDDIEVLSLELPPLELTELTLDDLPPDDGIVVEAMQLNEAPAALQVEEAAPRGGELSYGELSLIFDPAWLDEQPEATPAEADATTLSSRAVAAMSQDIFQSIRDILPGEIATLVRQQFALVITRIYGESLEAMLTAVQQQVADDLDERIGQLVRRELEHRGLTIADAPK